MNINNDTYVDSIKNIRYQVKKVVALANIFSHSVDSAMLYAGKNKNYSCEDPTVEPLLFDAQVYADLLLSSFASLVDYYFIAVAIKLNISSNKIGCVQYKK